MSLNTTIEWTESTWNPITGCTKVSPGCHNCYAERMAKRLQLMGNPSYSNGFNITTHENVLRLPLQWKKPQTIFVNSMSDLFHEKIPEAYIMRVFEVMKLASWHVFQILTKRSERLFEIHSRLPWMPNIWMGVSVENSDYVHRIDHLRKTNAFTKFISFEPLLGPISSIDLDSIDWAIVGGESGPKARPLKEAWVIDIRDLCEKNNIPFFFKQWGGVNKKKNGRLLEGRLWSGMPSLATSSL